MEDWVHFFTKFFSLQTGNVTLIILAKRLSKNLGKMACEVELKMRHKTIHHDDN